MYNFHFVFVVVCWNRWRNNWLQEDHDLSRTEAVVVASVAVDLRVTQCVNGVVGVHGILREDRWRPRG